MLRFVNLLNQYSNVSQCDNRQADCELNLFWPAQKDMYSENEIEQIHNKLE